MNELYADSAQAREADRKPAPANGLDFFAIQNAVAPTATESPEQRKQRRARIERAMAGMEMICGYRK